MNIHRHIITQFSPVADLEQLPWEVFSRADQNSSALRCSGEYLKIPTYPPFYSRESHFQPPYKRLWCQSVLASAKLFQILSTHLGGFFQIGELTRSYFEIAIPPLPHCLHTIFSKLILRSKNFRIYFHR